MAALSDAALGELSSMCKDGCDTWELLIEIGPMVVKHCSKSQAQDTARLANLSTALLLAANQNLEPPSVQDLHPDFIDSKCRRAYQLLGELLWSEDSASDEVRKLLFDAAVALKNIVATLAPPEPIEDALGCS